MKQSRWLLVVIALGLSAAIAAAVAMTWKPEIAQIPPPAPASFDRAAVLHGEGLTHLGNCATCHTAAGGGAAFAGGKILQTPFGTIYSANITPDPETGIGRWSREAFTRAMREGVSRDGRHLYPAFPYDHFTRLTDADLGALYAFLMSRPPVVSRPPQDRLVWPLDHRPIVAGWNFLYLREGPMEDADRGQYLAEGLAHCGSCHTPRNKFGAESGAHAYDGAWVEGWYAPALNAHSRAPRPWTADDLFAYLRGGFSTNHAAAAGPMADVTHELTEAPEQDVRALAAYFARQMSGATAMKDDVASPDRREAAQQAHPEGAILFAGACANCHEAGAPMMLQGRPPLSWATALREETAHNVLHIVAAGLKPPSGLAGPAMPAFGGDFTDAQLAQIAAYLRARYSDLPPWRNLEKAVSDIRKGTGP